MSRTAFRSRLEGPLGWVVRDLDTDYGIDQEVEVFEDGQSTGLTFKVQLKSTERAEVSGAKVGLSVLRMDDWRQLDVPVLVALWVEETDMIYARWVHTIDRGPNPKKTKKFTLRYTDQEILDAGAPWLKRDLEIIRNVRYGGYSRPLPIRVESATFGQMGATHAVSSAISRFSLGSLVRISSDVEAFRISLEPDRVRAALPAEVWSLTMWRKDDQPIEQLGVDALLVLSAVLGQNGRFSDTVEILRATLDSSCITHEDDAAVYYVRALIETGNAELAIQLFLRALQHQTDETAALYFLTLRPLGVAANASWVMDVDQAVFARIVGLIGSDKHRAARWAFNSSQMLFDADRFEDAQERMRLAQRLDPAAYGKRADSFLLLGKTAWHLADFDSAIKNYRRAVKIGGIEFAGSQLADSLMHAGQYKKAHTVASQVLSAGSSNWRDWFVEAITSEITDRLGIRSQQRTELTTLDFDSENATDHDVDNHLRNIDALDNRVWTMISQRFPPDLKAAAVAAYLSGHPIAWAALIVRACHKCPSTDECHPADSQEAPAMRALLSQALREMPEIRDTIVLTREHLDAETVEVLDELLAASLETDPDPREIRFVNEANQLISHA